MYEIITFAGFLILFFLGLNVIYRSQGKKINLLVGAWLFSASIWALGQTFMSRSTDYESLLWSIGLAHLGVFFLSSTTLHFALVYPNQKKIMYNRLMPYIIYLLPVIFYIFFLTNDFHNLFYQNLSFNSTALLHSDKSFAIIGNFSFIMVYSFVVGGLVLFAHSTIRYKKSKQKGSFYLTMGILIGLISSILFEIDIIPSTTLFPVSGILFSYAIVKYKVVDITPVAAAEKIIDTMADCLVLTDENNRVKRVNNSFKTLLGYRDSNIIGKKINTYFKTDFHKKLYNGEVIRNISEIIETKDGKSINVSVNATSIKDFDNKIAGFIYTFSDVTEQKKAEEKLKDRTDQVERLLKQKDEFIHLLAHDLKAPLTPINTFLPMIKKRTSDEKSIEMLDISIKKVETIIDLIDDSLELARLDEVEQNFDFKTVKLDSVIDKVIDENHVFLEKNRFTIEKNIDKDIQFYCNEFQIKEVFNNLISNAVKYTPENREGLIVITAFVEDNSVKVSVSDNGRGLASEEIDHVFDKFYKYGVSRDGMRSTGLGLSLCKSIIDKHDGRIWVESDGKDKGSTFYFSIPSKDVSKNVSNDEVLLINTHN